MSTGRTMDRRHLLGAGLLAALGTTLAACGKDGPDPAPSGVCRPGVGPITFIGDSYVNGTDNDSGALSRFPSLISRDLLVPSRILASNGSGYTVVGPSADAKDLPGHAEDVLADTSIVVIFGGRNDMHDPDRMDEIEGQATRTIRIVRERAPRAQVLVVGPPWINPWPSEEILHVRDQVRAAAEDAAVGWLDPIADGWFAEEDQLVDGRSRLIAEDRIHPTDEGHAYLAEKLMPHIEDRIC